MCACVCVCVCVKKYAGGEGCCPHQFVCVCVYVCVCVKKYAGGEGCCPHQFVCVCVCVCVCVFESTQAVRVAAHINLSDKCKAKGVLHMPTSPNFEFVEKSPTHS